MALRTDRTKDLRDTAAISAQAGKLFEEWEAEEEAGYRGEVSWEDFRRDLDAGRPSHNRAFPESSS